ncbi:MAG TPA: PspC domain-containing protein [Steroidobacteraceae bacterium]|jgi:phage shock protein PspC (stress-responsive transcriptional regulator)
MRKVVTISLNGNAYQLEEGGYEALRAYLDSAQAKLRDDPGCAEILADLEQAIAEKCAHFLGPNKGVVTTEEITQVLTEMGPVVSDADAGSGAGAASDTAQGAAGPGTGSASPKRLYRIREGAVIGGVCTGIAAFWGADVSIVRLLFVAFTVLTGGAWILAYIIMMFAIPGATTSEEHAAAHGVPFTAEQLIEQAKKQYEAFTNGSHWRQWRREERARRREWRREWRRGRKEMRDSWNTRPYWGPQYGSQYGAAAPDTSAAGYAARVVAGIFAPIIAIVHAVLLIGLIVSIAQLVSTGTLFGWMLPPGVPFWAGIIVVCIIYSMFAGPLHAVRHSVYANHSPTANAWFAVWGGIIWLGFLALFAWLAYQYWPEVQRVIEAIADSIREHRPPARIGTISMLDFKTWRPD